MISLTDIDTLNVPPAGKNHIIPPPHNIFFFTDVSTDSLSMFSVFLPCFARCLFSLS